MNYLLQLIIKRKLILSLSLVDFNEQFSNSYLGVAWAVIRPLFFISVVWVIFSIGIKANKINSDIPFIIYLLAGYIPWIFFSTTLTGIMNSFIGNKTLVKRPSFQITILPIVKILSFIRLHIIFLLILIIIMLVNGIYPTIFWLQLPYYLFMTILLLFGFGLMLASFRVFTQDIVQFIGAILQVGFWVTPIFWSIEVVPEKYLWLLNFNPMVYIVNGYRNTFINEIWFWQDSSFLFSFLIYMVFFLLIGIYTFKKLRPHFGDVL